MSKVSHIFSRAASHRVARAVSHLNQAGEQLTAATRAADRYHQQRLRRLAADLRELSQPLAGLVSSLHRGGER